VGEAQLERNVSALGKFIDGGASPVTIPNATTVYDIIEPSNVLSCERIANIEKIDLETVISQDDLSTVITTTQHSTTITAI
jgi:hypothetical protein